MESSRRDVLKLTAAVAGATAAMAAGTTMLRAQEAAGGLSDMKAPESERRGDMLYRKLGSTGDSVSIIGLGGYHIGMQKEEEESIRLIRTAIDRGITFMDNCWDYHNGGSEIRMGKALRDGYRDKVFLMTKIDGRTRQHAARQLDECLKRLQTDRIDLVQHHEIIRMEDPDRVFAPGGANEALVEAQKAGKIRFIGFTGHKDPIVHLRMLEIADQHKARMETAQMPVNVLDAHFRSFTQKVIPELVKRNMGVLAMKTLAGGHALKSKTVSATECLHFAMSMPTSVVITGMDTEKILNQALDAVKTFQPMKPDQVAALLEKTKQAAPSGKFEPFKTTSMYDGTAHHPEWLG
ncbi:MAG TPA: aldo/keto reductase [Tepidisphaeraceae bacterium]|jgi:predicted aldo/keto reductase-like oxidoreductase